MLSWALEGTREFWDRGLDPPAPVQAALESYQRETDPLADFIDERCILDKDARDSKATVYDAYKARAEGEGIRQLLTKKRFGCLLKSRGFEDGQRGPRRERVWCGLSVNRS